MPTDAFGGTKLVTLDGQTRYMHVNTISHLQLHLFTISCELFCWTLTGTCNIVGVSRSPNPTSNSQFLLRFLVLFTAQ